MPAHGASAAGARPSSRTSPGAWPGRNRTAEDEADQPVRLRDDLCEIGHTLAGRNSLESTQRSVLKRLRWKRRPMVRAMLHAARMNEIRYALRQLRRSPGFTAVALITLILGMGANSAFFSVLYGVVLRQPPYPEAERLVTLHNLRAGEMADGGRIARAEVRDYRERQRAFDLSLIHI